MSTTVCQHHQHGHCKYGVHCRNQHTKETCYSFPCIETTCSKRHPKVCRFFSISGSCKFNSSCSYLHKHGHNEKMKEVEKEVVKLKEEIKLLTTEVDKLKEIISSLSIASSSKSVTLKNHPTPRSDSFSITPLNEADFSPPPNLDDVIPQLDGLQQEYVSSLHQPFQCETCHKVFPNSEEYKKHDALQFCCDDCGICYATQIQADLHVLQVHPDESYARNYIPEATKTLFTKQSTVSQN